MLATVVSLDPFGLYEHVAERVQKFNPNHDALGHFASATTAGEDAAIARLGTGQHAILSDANQVHSFLGQLYDISQHAKRLGQAAPLYDLGKVSVPGTNLFTQDNIGIPRAKMPQLSGVPIPGSKADAFPRNVNGEVDLAPAFKDYLAKQHISMVATSVRADHLRATQNELNGAKVAGIAHAIETGHYHPASIFVSNDHYILDGHHRWAAVVGESNPRIPIRMPVERINLDIRHLVPMANKFAADMGLPQMTAADAVTKAFTVDESRVVDFDPFDLADHLAYQFIQKFNPNHDGRGRFSSASGGSSASSGTSSTPIQTITATDMNHTDRSRAVSHEEFLALATEGRARLQHFIDTGSPPAYLDTHFADISSRAFAESQKPWGGVTVDTHTGKHVAPDADLYALTVKDPGQHSVTIDEHAPRTTFDKAMRVARQRFSHQLARSQAHLGVFHDDDQHRIDIDPVLVVDNLHDVETIGAYTHAIGGAYHFASGNGFWPPHVADTVTKAAAHSLGLPDIPVPIAQFLAGSRDASRPVLTDADLDTELLDVVEKFNPNQPRDQDGRWVGDGITTTGVSTDFGKIPAKYADAMASRAATLGITNEMLDKATSSMLARGNRAHADWYLQAHDAIGVMASRYNVSGDTAAGVVASLSPAREFGKNMRDAETILRVMHDNKPFVPTAASVEAFNIHRDPKRPIAHIAEYRPATMDATTLVGLHPELSKLGNKTGLVNVVRGVVIAKTGHVDANLSGPKMRSFYNNLADPRGSDVTIDTWMYRAMIPKDFRFASGAGKLAGRTMAEAEAGDTTHKPTKLQNIFQGSPHILHSGIANNVGLYPMFAQSVRRVAKARGLKPHAAQAMIWEVARSDGGYKPTDMSTLLAPWRT